MKRKGYYEEAAGYGLVAVKRWWIPNSFYAWFTKTFGNELGTKQPWRWMLHRELDEFTKRRNMRGGEQHTGPDGR